MLGGDGGLPVPASGEWNGGFYRRFSMGFGNGWYGGIKSPNACTRKRLCFA